MMIEDLLKNEQVIYKTKPHWILYGPAILWLFITLFILIFGSGVDSIGHIRILNSPPLYKMVMTGCFFVALYFGILGYTQREFTEYMITTKRVLVKTGLIHRKTTEMMAQKIEGIQVLQSPIGRMFNYGSVVVIGIGGSQDPFPYIPAPKEFRKKVQMLSNAASE